MSRNRVTPRRQLRWTAPALAATAVAGGIGTDVSSPWYRSLDKPPWQPPGTVFGPAWTTLYTLIAAASARSLDRIDDGTTRRRYARSWGQPRPERRLELAVLLGEAPEAGLGRDGPTRGVDGRPDQANRPGRPRWRDHAVALCRLDRIRDRPHGLHRAAQPRSLTALLPHAGSTAGRSRQTSLGHAQPFHHPGGGRRSPRAPLASSTRPWGEAMSICSARNSRMAEVGAPRDGWGDLFGQPGSAPARHAATGFGATAR